MISGGAIISLQTSEIVPLAEHEPQRVDAEEIRSFLYLKPVF